MYQHLLGRKAQAVNVVFPLPDECDKACFTFHSNITGLSDFEYAGQSNGVRYCVSKVGGGTLGKLYAGSWFYAVADMKTGRLIDHGDDLFISSQHSHGYVVGMLRDAFGRGQEVSQWAA